MKPRFLTPAEVSARLPATPVNPQPQRRGHPTTLTPRPPDSDGKVIRCIGILRECGSSTNPRLCREPQSRTPRPSSFRPRGRSWQANDRCRAPGFRQEELLDSRSPLHHPEETREFTAPPRVVERGDRNARLTRAAPREVISTTLNASALRAPTEDGAIGILRDMRELDKARAYARASSRTPRPVSSPTSRQDLQANDAVSQLLDFRQDESRQSPPLISLRNREFTAPSRGRRAGDRNAPQPASANGESSQPPSTASPSATRREVIGPSASSANAAYEQVSGTSEVKTELRRRSWTWRNSEEVVVGRAQDDRWRRRSTDLRKSRRLRMGGQDRDAKIAQRRRHRARRGRASRDDSAPKWRRWSDASQRDDQRRAMLHSGRLRADAGGLAARRRRWTIRGSLAAHPAGLAQ